MFFMLHTYTHNMYIDTVLSVHMYMLHTFPSYNYIRIYICIQIYTYVHTYIHICRIYTYRYIYIYMTKFHQASESLGASDLPRRRREPGDRLQTQSYSNVVSLGLQVKSNIKQQVTIQYCIVIHNIVYYNIVKFIT